MLRNIFTKINLSAKIIENFKIFRRSLIYQTKEFFENSTLHGVRYIAESGRPPGEKFMWFCFLCIGTVAALIIIMSLWEKFQTNPTITGLDTDFHSQQIMFPTTIVCPINPFSMAKVNDLAFKIYNTNETTEFLQILTHLSFENINEAIEFAQNASSDVSNYENLRSLAFASAITCDEVFTNCQYRGEKIECCTHFDPVYTEIGFCYAFNSIFKSTEYQEVNGSPSLDLYETDKKWSLFFIPNVTSLIYIFSNEESFGADFKPHLLWESNQETSILISKKETYTTEDARQLSIKQRKCIFKDEIKLKYFKGEYTFSSCMKECRIKKVAKLCKCLPPFYKPIPSIPFCRIDQFLCLEKYKLNITNIKDCLQCELSCMKVVYNVEKLNSLHDRPDTEGVRIEFLTWPILRYKREVLFGWVDLLVSFGGIAGLFLGFSLLSGVEIIYYFTMRACCMAYKNKDQLQKIEEEIKKKPLPKIDMSLRIGTKNFSIIHPPRRSLSAPKKIQPHETFNPSTIDVYDNSIIIKPKIFKHKFLGLNTKVSSYDGPALKNNRIKSASEPAPLYMYLP